MITLQVSSAAVSARFYIDYCGARLVLDGADFIFLLLPNGCCLHLAEKAAETRSVLAFELSSDAALLAHRNLIGPAGMVLDSSTADSNGITRSFVVADPDGHRVRFHANIPRLAGAVPFQGAAAPATAPTQPMHLPERRQGLAGRRGHPRTRS